MRFLLRASLAAAVFGAIAIWARLPEAPLPVRLDESESLRRRTEWRGAYHIHSGRSDGTGTLDEIAQAASAAGLDFIIVTDHGDGTRTPEPPSYRSAVLVIDAVEISTTEGHYVALGLTRPAPYRLGGQAADVVADVRWLGGFGLAAHPDSPRRSLSWRDRTAPVDGLEWFNADSAWRDEPRLAMGLRLLAYPLRPEATVASLFDRPTDALSWWDAAAASGRQLVSLAALDAHARLGMRGTDDEDGRGGLAVEAPSYREMFGVATNRVWLASTPTGDAARDADLVLGAIRAGHTYAVIEPFARPGFLRAAVSIDGRPGQLGDRVAPGARLDLRIEVDGPAGADIRLLHNGLVSAQSAGPVLTVSDTVTSGSYRIEVHVPASRDRRAGMPWMVTNALFAWSAAAASPDAPAGPPLAGEEVVEIDLSTCSNEADVDSEAGWTARAEGGYDFRYLLARSASPFAALACPLPMQAAAVTGVGLEGRSAPVMRVLSQFRAPDATRDLRWGSSIRVDGTSSSHEARRQRFVPLTRDAASSSPASADTLLLVIDRRHAAAGAEGVVTVTRLWLTTATTTQGQGSQDE